MARTWRIEKIVMNKSHYSQIGIALATTLCLIAAASPPLRLQAAESAREPVAAPKPQPQLDDPKAPGSQGWDVKPPCVLSNMSTCPPGTEDFDSLDLMPLHLLGIPEGYRSAVKPKSAR
jgi:hypothetical protein